MQDVQSTAADGASVRISRYEVGAPGKQLQKNTHPVRLTILWIVFGVVGAQIFQTILSMVFARVSTPMQYAMWFQYASAIFVPPAYVAAWWLATRRPLNPSAVIVPALVVFTPSFLSLLWVAAYQAYYGVSGSVFGFGIPWVLISIAVKVSQAMSAFAVMWLAAKMFRIRLTGRDEKVYARPLRIQDIALVSIIVAVSVSLESWLPVFGVDSRSFAGGWFLTQILFGLFTAIMWAVTFCLWGFRGHRFALVASVVAVLVLSLLEAGRNVWTYMSFSEAQNLAVGTPGILGVAVGSLVSCLLSIAGILIAIRIAEMCGYVLRVVPRQIASASQNLDLSDSPETSPSFGS